MASNNKFDERAGRLMKVLVETYISSGQPIGSKSLLKFSGLKISPATVRNIMVDLEKIGLIHSPHTSAGRVPTIQGYRFFVDSLLSVQPLQQGLVKTLKNRISEQDSQHDILEKASSTLSGLTSLASLVVLPDKELVSLSQIEFIPLSGNRILAVLVQSDNEVQNRIIQMDVSYSQAQLQQMSNYLNTFLAGRSIKEVCHILIKEMNNTRKRMDELMRSAITVAGHAFAEHHEERNDFVISGETNLMQYSDMADMETIRSLFEAFHEKQHILRLLQRVNDAEGVQVFIGEESEYRPLDRCSIVAAPYQIAGQSMGVLGVIGPTRMPYDRVIPIVDITAKLLSSALNHEN